MNPAQLLILGEGRWGQAMGTLARQLGHEVSFVHHHETSWPQRADALLIALPVQHLRATLQRFPNPEVPVLSLSKGLEISTGACVSQIVRDLWPTAPVAALSGPNLASEITQGLPAAAVVAAPTPELATYFQHLLHQAAFRLYTSTDLSGVELGGALKNVYAIAGGVCAGLRLGENAFAALLTRCLAEMTRLGVQLGGRAETFSGLSGVGDLFLTAISPASRNHRVGRLIAEGHDLADILQDSPGVAEGLATAQALYHNPAIAHACIPVACEIYAILYEKKSPLLALQDLMGRMATMEMH
jgi:glycerol-3-phosphate dehydrogenase (NAD(P)+)